MPNMFDKLRSHPSADSISNTGNDMNGNGDSSCSGNGNGTANSNASGMDKSNGNSKYGMCMYCYKCI